MALPMVDRASEIVYADDSIENYDRSQELELEDSIESMQPKPKHSGFMSASGDLPTPPVGHPSEEGIFRREIIEYKLYWKQMRGYDFDRQRPIDRYIVDFYCKDLKLAIEIDDSSHDGEEAKINDEIRQERLESLSVRFLRFTDADVKRNMEMVVGSIEQWIDELGL
jgi:very-short-patch-repair endonuclease